MTTETKKIEYGTAAYERSMAHLADYFLRVVQCKKCGAARNYEYVCVRCWQDDSGDEE